MMSQTRRAHGDETWNRLRWWTGEQKASERLAARILAAEGFELVDPSHPLGGPDGLKDVVFAKGNTKWVGAAYFPSSPQTFGEIRSKFLSDAKGATANAAGGFAFVTNQHLTVGQRETLRCETPVPRVEIYHLERIALILDTPACYGIRLVFLDIEMTKEEQVAVFATVVDPIIDLLRQSLSCQEMYQEENREAFDALAGQMKEVSAWFEERMGRVEEAIIRDAPPTVEGGTEDV